MAPLELRAEHAPAAHGSFDETFRELRPGGTNGKLTPVRLARSVSSSSSSSSFSGSSLGLSSTSRASARCRIGRPAYSALETGLAPPVPSSTDAFSVAAAAGHNVGELGDCGQPPLARLSQPHSSVLESLGCAYTHDMEPAIIHAFHGSSNRITSSPRLGLTWDCSMKRQSKPKLKPKDPTCSFKTASSSHITGFGHYDNDNDNPWLAATTSTTAIPVRAASLTHIDTLTHIETHISAGQIDFVGPSLLPTSRRGLRRTPQTSQRQRPVPPPLPFPFPPRQRSDSISQAPPPGEAVQAKSLDSLLAWAHLCHHPQEALQLSCPQLPAPPLHHHHAPIAGVPSSSMDAQQQQHLDGFGDQQDAAGTYDSQDYRQVCYSGRCSHGDSPGQLTVHNQQQPAVGDKTSSEAIAEEYAKADPVYVSKTLALRQIYSHYRPIRGDGNCGWRAIGFEYFDNLIEQADEFLLRSERSRLISLNELLPTVGGYSFVEDFADVALDLVDDIASHMHDSDTARRRMCERWNDAYTGNSIIYYFRLLCGLSLKMSPATYDAFIPNGIGVLGYCSQVVEVVDKEIEHIAINALVDILYKPAGLALEIAYLDRSPGSEVNHYRFPKEANGEGPAELGPVAYLLYRPDHYDILYRAPQSEPVSADPVPTEVNVSSMCRDVKMSSPHCNLATFATADYELLGMIPGFDKTVGTNLLMSTVSNAGAADVTANAFAPALPQHSWLARCGWESASNSTAPPHQNQHPLLRHEEVPRSMNPMAMRQAGGAAMMAPQEIAVQYAEVAVPHGSGTAHDPRYHIRFSPVQLEYAEKQFASPEPQQVMTSTFKNSIFNRAHYGNPQFHPEQWIPEKEKGRGTGKRKVGKNSF